MSFYKYFYNRAPVLLQNLIVNSYALFLKKARYSENYKLAFQNYKENVEKWKSNSLNEKRNQDILFFLASAKETNFWKDRFKRFKVDLSSFSNVKDEISKLPILTKEEVKKNIKLIDNSSFLDEKIKTTKTGGTTGQSLEFPQTLSSINEQWAIWWRYRMMHGIDRNTWCGWFGGKTIVPASQKSPPFWRKDYIGKQVMFSPLHLNSGTFEFYYQKIKEEKLTWLHGYSSQLSLLASFINDANLPPIDTIEIITIGSENLSDRQKKEIMKAFGVSVRQHYGLAEGVANISEWPDGKLRVDKDFCYVEFIPVEEGADVYRIVGTNFTNPAFPLIRYDTGDLAKVKEVDGELIVEEIMGRGEDYITLPNGNRFGPMNLVFKPLKHIREAQVYQPSKDRLVFRVIKGKNFDRENEESKLYKEIKNRITDGSVEIEVEYLDKLPRTNSGKLKTVISEV